MTPSNRSFPLFKLHNLRKVSDNAQKNVGHHMVEGSGEIMESERNSVIDLFKPERQFCVPFYQRPYVWNQADQWSRLWSDIQEKAEARLAGLPSTPHFMGAVVLDPQERKKLIGVEKIHIIDGQQRFTTIQFALEALSIKLAEWGYTGVLPVVEACLRNSDERNMQDKAVDSYKVWPTFYDREAYQKAISAKRLDDLRTRFPGHFTQQHNLRKIGIDHPPALEAIWFFADQMADWLPKTGRPGPESAEALASAILRDLVVISITLEEQDDAQVIFETLNGHGVELTATDLIRNYVFLRAEAEGSDTAALYKDQWQRYESDNWKQDETRGRFKRPRIEWFIQTVIQTELRDDVDQGRIYAEYQRYVKKSGAKAEFQLTTLAEYADSYQSMLDGNESKPIGRFGKKYAEWDASTTYVLALAISKSETNPTEQDEMFGILGSYIVRRAICNLTNKNYNKVFLQIIKGFKDGVLTEQSLRAALTALTGEATRWPKDDEFRAAFLRSPMYPGRLDPPKLRSIFVELENALRTERSEEPVAPALANLDIDHMLPQDWSDHWPLRDGTSATKQEKSEAWTAHLLGQKLTERQTAILAREDALKTFGNLTLLHYGTNRAAKNRNFGVKHTLFVAHSNLHLNRDMMTGGKWDEESVQNRGDLLFKAALNIWPGPG